MSSSETRLDALVERALSLRTADLDSVIESENLYEYELGHEDIIYADSLNWAVVPCEDLMILAREHYDKDSRQIVAEYAIYKQRDHDGKELRNSLNMNAVYKLEFVSSKPFSNLAYAIESAAQFVRSVTGENDCNHNRKED